MRWLTPTWAIWCSGNTPKLGWNSGVVTSTKTCNISETVRDRTKVYYYGLIGSRHTRFQLLVPKSMTVDDLERPKRTLLQKNRSMEATRKI